MTREQKAADKLIFPKNTQKARTHFSLKCDKCTNNINIPSDFNCDLIKKLLMWECTV